MKEILFTKVCVYIVVPLANIYDIFCHVVCTCILGNFSLESESRSQPYTSLSRAEQNDEENTEVTQGQEMEIEEEERPSGIHSNKEFSCHIIIYMEVLSKILSEIIIT